MQTNHSINSRNTLRKQERLKSRKLLDQLFREGNQIFVHPFKVYYKTTRLASSSPLQAAFGVSARVFKKAVDRNRIKRLMREAYRLQKPTALTATLKQNMTLAVFFLYVGRELPDYSVVSDKMQAVIKKLCDENSSALNAPPGVE